MKNLPLDEFLKNKSSKRKELLRDLPLPRIFDMEKEEEIQQLTKQAFQLNITEVIDEYEDMLEELYFCRNASHKFQYKSVKEIPAYNDFVKSLFNDKPLVQTGTWVYFPWKYKLVHFLSKNLHEELRTARNKGLVTHEEQEKFRQFKVGIAGLSIGQSAAYTIAVNGGCEVMHLADFDVISATNTNRIRASFDAVGINKAIYLAQMIYEVNPYANLKLFVDGLTETNMDSFFSDLDAVVDEIDNFPMKVKIREEAKRRKIPVVMAADMADAIGLDVERYDLDDKQAFFNGKLDEEDFDRLRSPEFGFNDMARIFMKMNGGSLAPKRLRESVPLIGRELAGPPQLGSTAFLSGTVISYIIKKIAIGEKINLGSAILNLDTHLLK
ncbi:MAG: ThiF family adenylyltransferase [Candidatus Daviesbacteria bacterium]|nr:ThiF family adenylyltransferase [Candidatus Daviesbacteria bacterium]